MTSHQDLISHVAWRNFDLSEVTERFRLKSPFGYLATDLERETRRFLFLTAKTNRALVPSESVDEYWHAMILNTATYRRYCNEAFGTFIEHSNGIPESTPDAFARYCNLYRETQALYEAEFNEKPPLQAWPQIEGRVEQRLAAYKNPYRIHLETTNHCNLRCEHCYPESSSENPHHDRSNIDLVLDEAARLKVGKITLTGGEVLTRPDWKEIFTKALDTCDNIYFITNGLLLTRSKLEWLAKQRSLRSLRNWRKALFQKSPVEIGVAISLDGLAGNELVRKNDAGAGVKATQIIEKIKSAVDYGLHVTVNTTITNSTSAKEIKEMYDLLSTLGIDRWQVDQAYLAGRLLQSNLKSGGLAWLDDAKEGYKYIVKSYLKDYPRLPKWRLEIVQVFRYDSLFHGFSPTASLDDHPCTYHFGSMIVWQTIPRRMSGQQFGLRGGDVDCGPHMLFARALC